ncbi:MAG: competence protein ComK [Acholeplasmataceae bacterium]|jgi:competence transcription factor ComK|nr:competence protein ComK [Acholeplasmataceae bacterium]
MIEYIENNASGSQIFFTDTAINSTLNAFSYIKKLCEKSLFTYDGYISAVKKWIDKTYQIPIYIDERQGFLPTMRVRDYENMWINMFAIYDIEQEKEGINILFISGRRLYINYSMKRFKKQMELLMKIKSLKVNIFISNHIEMYRNK